MGSLCYFSAISARLMYQEELTKVQNKGTSLDTAHPEMSNFQIYFQQKPLLPPTSMAFRLSKNIYFMTIYTLSWVLFELLILNSRDILRRKFSRIF